MENIHIISEDKTLLEALIQLNTLVPEPLVLFVVDNQQRMVGTLTDGDSRRALIAGASKNDIIKNAMQQDFKFLQVKVNYDVKHIHELKRMKIKLLPILDESRHIIDIINFEKVKTKLPVDAVLMAGGRGERLRPLTEKTPKPLLKIGDKPIIDYNIDNLISYGIEHISVTVNYLAEQIEQHFSTPRNGVVVNTIREPHFLGTVGSVKFIPHFFHDTILIMNSDLFTNVDFEDFYLHFVENDADLSAVAIPYSVSVPYGIFEIDNRRDICGIKEKPTYNYYANGGIYMIKRSILADIPENTFFNATDLIEKLIIQGKKVIRFPLNGTWIDIGNKQEYDKAQEIAKHIT